MPFSDRSIGLASLGVGSSGLGGLVSILAFSLPYWIYYDENLPVSDASGNQTVRLIHHYGFWSFCCKLSSAALSSNRCGSVDTHSDAEQTTVGLLVLSIVLFISCVVNASLYLLVLKKQKLCLYVSLVSAVGAGTLTLAAVISHRSSDHNVKITETVVLTFTTSNLYASVWLAVAGIVFAVMAIMFIVLAIRSERPDLQDKEETTSSVSFTEEIPDKLKIACENIPYEEIGTSNGYSSDEPLYSSSSESTNVSEPCDSDDSDIEPAFAKLKTKLPKKASLNSIQEIKQQRSKSAELWCDIKSSIKKSSSLKGIGSIMTPVENADMQNGSDLKKTKLHEGVPREVLDVSQDTIGVDNFTLYFDNEADFEISQAPAATNLKLIRTTLGTEAGSFNDIVLRRAKTEMPFTQKMKETIEKNQIDRHAPLKEETAVVAGHPFIRKPPKLKRKSESRPKEDKRRKKQMTDAYNTLPTVVPYVPKTSKPAPWSKSSKSEKSFKWSLKTYGIEIPSPILKKKKKKKKMRVSNGVTLDDSEA